MNYQDVYQQIKAYEPVDEKELEAKERIISLLLTYQDRAFLRDNEIGHITASAIVLNEKEDKVLFAYHSIYDSWAWLGGHADGEKDLLSVAIKEVKEETGVKKVSLLYPSIARIDVLPVKEHVKKGKTVPFHYHYDVCYLLKTNEDEPIRPKEDENKDVAWIPIHDLSSWVKEKEMLEVYYKIMERKDSYLLSKKLLSWFRKEQRDLPWRKTTDPYPIWISEIMLQQTRVETVKDYYERFLTRFPTIQDFANGSMDEILKLWEGLGYYSRARNMHKCATEIVHLGFFPSTYEELRRLPGIGNYTAAAVASNAFKERVAAVDGNVLRVMSRIRNDESDIALEATKKKYKEMIENDYLLYDYPGEMNQAFMELGATICIPKSPKCEICPIHSFCKAIQEGKEKVLPIKKAKVKQKIEEKTALFYLVDDELLLVKKNDGLLRGFYGPILLDRYYSLVDIENMLVEEKSKGMITELEPVEHVFTHRIWEMKGYVLRLKKKEKEGEWFSFSKIEKEVALPSAYKKFYLQIIRLFQK